MTQVKRDLVIVLLVILGIMILYPCSVKADDIVDTAITYDNDAVFYLSDADRTTVYKYTISGFSGTSPVEEKGTHVINPDSLAWSRDWMTPQNPRSFLPPDIINMKLYASSIQAHRTDWHLKDGTFLYTEEHPEFAGSAGTDDGRIYYGLSITFKNFKIKTGYHVEERNVDVYTYGTNDRASAYNYLYTRDGSYDPYVKNKNDALKLDCQTNFKELLTCDARIWTYGNKESWKYNLGNISSSTSFDADAGTMTLNGQLFYFGGLTWKDKTSGKTAMQSDIPVYVFNPVPNTPKVTLDANWGMLYDYMQTNTWTNITHFTTEYGKTYWNDIGGTQPKRDGFTFEGWYTDRDGGTKVYNADGTCVNGTGYWKNNLWSYEREQDVTLYAHWKQSTHKLTVRPNGGVWNGSGDQQEFTMNAGSTKTIDNPVRAGFTFRGWTVDGTGSSMNATTFKMGNADTVLTAEWEKNSYNVRLNAGTGVKNVTGAGSYLYNAGVSVSAALQEGYHWKGWTGSYEGNSNPYRFTMPANDVEMTAEGEANTYTIVFDPNGGTGHMDGISAQYDTDVTLPDGASGYQKYTLDGVNVTEEVTAGTISLSVPEESEELEPLEDDPEALQRELEESEGLPEEAEVMSEETEVLSEKPETRTPKVYPSVFMGWSLEDGRNSFLPQWKAGDTVRNLTAEDNGVVTLYAIWDDCPWIQADDLYYTLEQAQSGFITEQEILSHAAASDREDGSPIEAGFHDNGTSFSIPDYQPEDFTQFEHDGSVTENLTVVDSMGSVYRKQITVHIVDTASVAQVPEGTTRFIDGNYLNASYENGGLEENSIWKINEEYASTLASAIRNLRDQNPERSFVFIREEIEKMKQFVEVNGIGKTQKEDALTWFYNRFIIS